MINRLSHSRLGNISFIALVTISYFVPRSLRSLVTKYDIVPRAIKLISPRLSYENLYIAHKLQYLYQLIIQPTLTLVIFRKYWAALLKVYLTNARNFMIKHFECQHVKTNDTRSVDILSVNLQVRREQQLEILMYELKTKCYQTISNKNLYQRELQT